jgi:hypothetical protein
VSVTANDIQKIVVGFAACDHEQKLWHVGQAIGFLPEPSVIIDTGDGHVHWIASICRLATHDEEVAYWRDRAERAETAIRAGNSVVGRQG